MKKRIVCVLLTLIMLVGMLPLSASAAGYTTSEKAITVLKQLQSYNQYCTKHGNEWRNGYGTICTLRGDHEGVNAHTITEKQADKALRAKLAEIEKAVNGAGFSLNQNQFDALVVLSYDLGTSWLNGTGVLKSAVSKGLTGNAFLNAIGQTASNSSGSTVGGKIQRRFVEANMYLNGAYSNVAPSNYSYVTYDANGGTMPEGVNGYYVQFFDKNLNAAPAPVPTKAGNTFLGWYMKNGSSDTWVPHLSSYQGQQVLYACWQANGTSYENAKVVYNWQSKSILASTVIYDNPKDAKAVGTHTDVNVILDRDYIDAKGNRWGHLQNNAGWVLVSGSADAGAGFDIDVTVTVTNSSLNRRVNASISSGSNGSYKKGDQLRIVNTEMGSGLLWGQVADDNGTLLGWVALRYTNWDSVKNNPTSSNTANNTKAIATAVVNCAGYLNVRSAAGTDSAIVGALADGDHVEIYEIKFVNGHQWGRTTQGWILLTYAKVDMLDTKLDMSTAEDVLAYTFTGRTNTALYALREADGNSERVGTEIAAQTVVAMSMVKNDENGKVWGFNGVGWIPLESVSMDTAKYVVVADSVTVRSDYRSDASMVEKVVKGVELDIIEIAVVDATIWGKTEKYGGWVNLASKYVQRSNAPIIENVEGTNKETGLVGTVINTGSVKVRTTGATYGAVIGSLAGGTTVKVWPDEGDGWYKVDSNRNGVYEEDGDGWVYGQYLDVYFGTIEDEEDTTASGTANNTANGSTAVETGLGIVANTYSGVRVRQGAGTGYAQVGTMLPGTAVEILEVTSTATSKWGRTAQGWVCMDYITMVSKYPIGGTGTTAETDPNAGQNTGGSTATTEGNTTITSTPAVYAGTVKADASVRKTADVDAIEIANLTVGQSITIQELRAVTSEKVEVIGDVVDGNANTTTQKVTKTTTYWARVNGGWVQNPEDCLSLNPLDERTYTVVDYDSVNVRNYADINAPKLMSLDKGTQVVITELQITDDKVWGKAEDLGTNGGWIRLDNLAEGAISVNTTPTVTTPAPTQPTVVIGNTSNVGGYVANASGYRYTGKVINTNEVNVRSTASTASAITTQLKYGQSLVIYETTISENMAWGRCDAGWVYLYYVDLTPVVNGAVDARVVYNENTIIYTDVNCSAVAGTYARMSVIDIYEVVGTMARTDKGWVSTNDLL